MREVLLCSLLLVLGLAGSQLLSAVGGSEAVVGGGIGAPIAAAVPGHGAAAVAPLPVPREESPS